MIAIKSHKIFFCWSQFQFPLTFNIERYRQTKKNVWVVNEVFFYELRLCKHQLKGTNAYRLLSLDQFWYPNSTWIGIFSSFLLPWPSWIKFHSHFYFLLSFLFRITLARTAHSCLGLVYVLLISWYEIESRWRRCTLDIVVKLYLTYVSTKYASCCKNYFRLVIK